MQPYPRSPDLVWPGHLHSTGCLSARAVGTGFPTVVRCLCLGPGCGLVWDLLTPPVLAGVLGGCVWARFVVLPLFCGLFVVFVVGLRFWPAYGTCVDAALPPVSGSRLAGSPAWHGLPQCPGCGHWVSYCFAAFVFGSGLRFGVGFVNPASPGWGLGWVCLGTVCGVAPLLRAVCGVCGWAQVLACLWDVCGCVRAPLGPCRFWFWCAVWACVLGPGLGCAPPFLAGLSGCVFSAPFFFVWFCGVCCWVPLSGALWPLSPHPLSFKLGCRLFPFFLLVVCVPGPGGPLFLALCCRFWLAGPPVPLSGSCPRCLLGGGFGRPLWCWRAVWWLWAVSPPVLFFGGGGCLFLPLRSLGWRTHWPAFSVVFRAAVGGCVLFGRVPAP